MLLVVNAGSSSLKLAVFDRALTAVAQARFEGIRSEEDHLTALQDGLAQMGLPMTALKGAAHRVVHGGAALTAPCRITPATRAAIQDCLPLAPLHNPANLRGITAIARLAPDLPQYASFDTAFHATNPRLATTYALPLAERDLGLRRYGFHGLSYAALVRAVQDMAPDIPKSRLLALHLGNGASLCAIQDGVSVATTMGYSPVGGLTMGTRAGEVDATAVLHLADRHGIAGAASLLNHQSGLLALGGAADMRALHAAATPEATFAIDHFCYWAIRHSGAMIAAMGGLDAVAFTGGIGENDAVVRARIVAGLAFLGAVLNPDANAKNAPVLHEPGSRVVIWTVPAQEERQIAHEALQIMKAARA